MQAYIYKITNIINNKSYIGQSNNFKRRKSEHLKTLKAKTHRNKYLQRAYDKYGKENFIFEILEEYTFPKEYTKDYIREYMACEEIKFILNLSPEYNLYKEINESRLGRKWNDNQKKKQSDRLKGKQPTWFIGRRNTPEQIEKSVTTRRKNAIERGFWFTPEQLENKKESIAKMNEARKGSHHSYETRLLCAEGNKKEENRDKKVVVRKGENIVGIYNMIREAATDLNLLRTAIDNNINGRSKTCGGYTFTYEKINNE